MKFVLHNGREVMFGFILLAKISITKQYTADSRRRNMTTEN